jgi:hypothetical protein
MTKSLCEQHSDLITELATATERTRQLERERDELTGAVLAFSSKLEKLDQRIVGVKLTLAKWGGAIAILAASPIIVQVVKYVVSVAEGAEP